MGYEWTKTKTGKKWLFSKKEGRWHDCPLTSKNKNKSEDNLSLLGKFNKDDYDFCDLCSGFYFKESVFINYPQLVGIHQTIQEHKNMWHPNGEILDFIDFMVITEKEKEKKRLEWDVPKRTKPYNKLGIFVK